MPLPVSSTRSPCRSQTLAVGLWEYKRMKNESLPIYCASRDISSEWTKLIDHGRKGQSDHRLYSRSGLWRGKVKQLLFYIAHDCQQKPMATVSLSMSIPVVLAVRLRHISLDHRPGGVRIPSKRCQREYSRTVDCCENMGTYLLIHARLPQVA